LGNCSAPLVLPGFEASDFSQAAIARCVLHQLGDRALERGGELFLRDARLHMIFRQAKIGCASRRDGAESRSRRERGRQHDSSAEQRVA
jgi:hypothetical protein